MIERRSDFTPFKFLITFILGSIVTIGAVYYYKDLIFPVAAGNGVCYTSCENKVVITDTDISESVKKIYDAVVLIENYSGRKVISTGTGFVYKIDADKGYILTNYHVVEGNTSLKITLSNDEVIDAEYVAGDEFLDIAIITIAKDKVLKVAELGDSTKSSLGDTVFTVGTPVDYEYRGTVTRGILSGKDRLVSVSLSGSADDYIMKVLQTDAAINPGNSGGPLVNSKGEVIGINSLKLVENEIEGMGFAIPIEDILSHVKQLEKGEKIIRPYLGISMLNTNETFALRQSGITIDSNIDEGVVIVSVQKDTSAYEILQAEDVITKVNGVKIKNIAYLRYELYKYNVGDKIKITYIRGKEEKTAEITLKKQ